MENDDTGEERPQEPGAPTAGSNPPAVGSNLSRESPVKRWFRRARRIRLGGLREK